MMGFLTFLFAGCTAFAAWSMAAGNPAAINGVIGAGRRSAARRKWLEGRP